MEYYEVAICDAKEWDWQAAVYFMFDSLEEAVKLVKLSLENGHIVQIKQGTLDETAV